MADWIAIATWEWGQTAVRTAAPLLQQGKTALDAALAGAQAVEDDPKVHSVGYGAIGNSIGTVSLDACVMDGKTMGCGAVAGVENIRHVAALARKVMEKTPHNLLVGLGAQQFALQNGFPLQTLITPECVALWEKKQPREGGSGPQKAPMPELAHNHDTVSVLARDSQGNLAGVCTTSGLSYKLPGRVGDSPLIGHGLYVDNTAGAAGGTGIGEEIIRINGSFSIVESMRAGKSAQEACEIAIRRVHALAARRGVHPSEVSFIALDKNGQVGNACTPDAKFVYAVTRPSGVELLKGKVIQHNE